MAMKELLCVTMDALQVREACVEFAKGRVALNGETTPETIGIPADIQVSVVFRKKRERKPKAAPA